MLQNQIKQTYLDLINQNYRFPQDGFKLKDGFLNFHGIPLINLIEKHRTPFRFMYLPKIGEQIQKAKRLFNQAIKKNNYQGKYHFCYCTKCNHFYHVINKALEHKVNLETSSAFDVDLIMSLFDKGKIDKERTILHNGYKTIQYLQKIINLQEMGFKNSLIILDTLGELEKIEQLSKNSPKRNIGIRVGVSQEPNTAYCISRFGIADYEVMNFYEDRIRTSPKVSLKMVHFFVDTGIKDSAFYWQQFDKVLQMYVELKQKCPTLDSLNLGGGFPIKNSLDFEYSYETIIENMVKKIKAVCIKNNIPEPDIYTEFGKFTVGEAGATIFEVIEQKKQSNQETWYIINNSLMNTLPDIWSIQEKFILLPINKWQNEFQKVSIGGISCDHSDYYNTEGLDKQIYLPTINKNDTEPLYLGFFHTGAYQDSISGYGGIKHCLIPSPKHVIIDKDANGNSIDTIYREEQSVIDMFKILGYER